MARGFRLHFFINESKATDLSKDKLFFYLPYLLLRKSGDPQHCSSPLAMMAIRSPRRSASSIKCVVSRMVRPRFSPCRRSHVARRADGSMPDVGSSNMTTWWWCRFKIRDVWWAINQRDRKCIMFCEILHLGVSNEGYTNWKFSLHATREGLGTSLSLVFKVQDADDPVHLVWYFVFGVAFKLDNKQKNTLKTKRSSKSDERETITCLRHKGHNKNTSVTVVFIIKGCLRVITVWIPVHRRAGVLSLSGYQTVHHAGDRDPDCVESEPCPDICRTHWCRPCHW